jgi:DNA-binding transcriptional MerR regulator
MNIQRYSISDLEKLTGIKAHTIRVWEKRYGIISPERTDTNIRFYSVGDLHRLLNISFLNRNGFKISLISEMNDGEIEQTVSRISEKPGADEGFVPDLITAVSNLDEDLFERVLNTSILKLGFEPAFQEVVFPLLEKVLLMWQLGRINACQERFVNNLIRHKLVVAIDGLVGQNEVSKKNILLFLPSGHYDEIQLLYANYLLRKLGNHVIYLGPSIPLDHLRSLSGKTTIDYLVVSINPAYPEKEFGKYIHQLTEIFPKSLIGVITTPVDYNDPIDKHVQLITSCKGFHQVLESFN